MQQLGKVLHSLTYFQKVKNEHFENKFFQGNGYALIIITSTVESQLGAIQKHQELASSG